MQNAAEQLYEMCKWAQGRKDVKSEHITLYSCMLQMEHEKGGNVFAANSRQLMSVSRIRNRNTYYKTVADLTLWGFLKRTKGKNQFTPTLMEILPFKSEKSVEGLQSEMAIRADSKSEKKEYAEGVYLSEKEYETLCKDFDKQTADHYIIQVSSYQKRGKKKYIDHNATIRNWIWRNKNQNQVQNERHNKCLQGKIRDSDGQQGEYTDSIPYPGGRNDSG